MTHTDREHYGSKHGNAAIDETLRAVVIKTARDGTISCATAHAIAAGQAVSPALVGKAIDIAEVRIVDCQLGIFKHSAESRTAPAVPDIRPELQAAITGCLVNGRLPCEAAWSVAGRCGLTRPQMGAVCDTLDIKINACQLGTFA
jgi:hypothetical protein